MTAEEKILAAEVQIRRIAAGELASFDCPFCGQTTSPDQQAFCCEHAANMVNAILDHLEFRNQMMVLDRALEYWDRVNRASPLIH